MLGTLFHRLTVHTLDYCVHKGSESKRAPVRFAAHALDRARTLVGLEQVRRPVPLPQWSGQEVERPMWPSDRKKLEKWRADQGIGTRPEGPAPDEARVAASSRAPVCAIKVYYKRGCPSARAAIDLLRERELEFEGCDIKGDEATLSWLKIVTGNATTPQIFIHGKSIGGFDALRELDHNGKLIELVGAQRGTASEVTVLELRERLQGTALPRLLDVRTAAELTQGILAGAVTIALDDLLVSHADLDRDASWVVYCKSGRRSLVAVNQLRTFGFGDVTSLKGGIDAWVAAGGDLVPRKPRAVGSVRLPVVHPEHSPFEGLADDFDGAQQDRLEGDALTERVQAVLAECRPLVQADGGDIELLDIRDDLVHVQLTGNCVGCPSAQATLHQGIERRLKSRIPQIRGIRSPQMAG
jgi:Fe-S cluster biogenesis protein NfuA/rhodanese-related sulfurtransferase/glutaredoxin